MELTFNNSEEFKKDILERINKIYTDATDKEKLIQYNLIRKINENTKINKISGAYLVLFSYDEFSKIYTKKDSQYFYVVSKNFQVDNGKDCNYIVDKDDYETFFKEIKKYIFKILFNEKE